MAALNTVDKQQIDPSTDDSSLQLVTFELDNEEFGIDILPVQEIVRMMQITRVPNCPTSVEGVVNLRGQITPVIDLRQKFNLPSREHCSESRIVVVEVHGQVLGFIVDKVNEVLQVDQSIVAPTPSQVTNADRDCLTGVAKLDSRLLILLDLDRLFHKREVEAAQQAADQ